jgi:uncharacterized MAPEG superfamily protein
MSFELTMLLWSAILTLVQMVVAAFGAMLRVGLPTLVGNREGMPPLTGWAGRAERAHRNMLESLIVFAVLVLVTEITNRNNWLTGLGSELFVGGRLAYAIVYIVGVPWLRTAVWIVSMAGLIVILLQLPLI